MTRAPQALALKSIRPTVLAGSHAFSRGGMGPLHKIATLAVAATLAALCGTVVARAEVQVSCTADHVVVRTKGATLAEILAGLEATCRTRIELNGATSRQFIGVYSGSLRDVLSRLLVGVDHIVHSAAGHITIAIDPQNAAYPHAIAAFPDNDGGSSVQGWVPSVSQIASAATTPRAQAAQPDATTDDAEKETSEVQGWVPSARLVVSSIVPAIAAAARRVSLFIFESCFRIFVCLDAPPKLLAPLGENAVTRTQHSRGKARLKKFKKPLWNKGFLKHADTKSSLVHQFHGTK